MWISIWNSEISTATGIYCGSRKLRPDGWWGWWKPSANTVAYYKLETDANDYSWNWYNLVTTHTSPSFETYQWVNCAKFNGSNMELHNNSLNPSAYWNSFTVSAWAYLWWWSATTVICNTYKSWSTYYNWALNKWSYSSYLTLWNGLDFWTLWPSSWWWYHLLFTCNNRSTITYVNWVQSNTWTLSLNLTNNWVFWIWTTEDGGSMYYYLNWWLSNIIVENKARTADEISTYYNKSKSNYWL